MARKTYGIKTHQSTVRGLDKLLKQFDAMPETITAGVVNGVRDSTNAVQTRAKLNIMAEDHLIANAIMSETEIRGKRVVGRTYVSSGPYGAVPIPVFEEMGTGRIGFESTSGPAGPKLYLSASGYTMHPWWYFDETGEYTGTGLPGFVRSEGQPANPYMNPAVLAERPFIKTRIADAINKKIREMGGTAR